MARRLPGIHAAILRSFIETAKRLPVSLPPPPISLHRISRRAVPLALSPPLSRAFKQGPAERSIPHCAHRIAPHRTNRLGLARRSNDPYPQNSNPLRRPGCVSRLSQRRCCTTVQPMARASSLLVRLGQHSTETGRLWSQSLLFAMCVPITPNLSLVLDIIPPPSPLPRLILIIIFLPISLRTVPVAFPKPAPHAFLQSPTWPSSRCSHATSHHPQPPISIYHPLPPLCIHLKLGTVGGGESIVILSRRLLT
jgi:hypothetical protein